MNNKKTSLPKYKVKNIHTGKVSGRFSDDGEEITLSSGKVINANKGIVGLGIDGCIYGGYDNIIDNAEWWEKELTSSEIIEIADLMITRWQAIKDQES